jgi:hypothetical protein
VRCSNGGVFCIYRGRCRFEYQVLINLPGNERVSRFIQWRDDMDHFEANKSAVYSVKSHVVEFRRG